MANRVFLFDQASRQTQSTSAQMIQIRRQINLRGILIPMSQDIRNDRERDFFCKQVRCQRMAKAVKSLPISLPLPDTCFFHYLATDRIASRIACQFSIRRLGTQKDIGLL